MIPLPKSARAVMLTGYLGRLPSSQLHGFCAMFDEHPNHLIVVSLCEFTPQIDFATRLAESAKQCYTTVGSKHWNVTQNSFTLRQTEGDRYLFLADFRRVVCHTFGWRAWKAKREAFDSATSYMLEKFDAAKVKMVTKTTFFAQLGMTHSEIVDLMFDSFLPERGVVETLYSMPSYDAAVHYYFNGPGSSKVRIGLFPCTPQDAESHLNTQPVDLFSATKYDAELAAWLENLKRDSLMIDIEHTFEELDRNAVAAERMRAISALQDATVASVGKLRGTRNVRS